MHHKQIKYRGLSLVNFKHAVAIVVIAIYLAVPFGVWASTSDGTINSTDKFAWGENIGWINFGTSEGNVHITDAGMTGYAWGENVGWISLNCSNTGSCGTVSYGVTNVGNGNLSGYAWGENVGWISFNCLNTSSCSTVDYGIRVRQTGEFRGYAWGENIGWISFNCSTTDSCSTVDYKVKTDYIPVLSGGGGGDSGETPPQPSPAPSPTPPASPSPTPGPTPPVTPSPEITPEPSPVPTVEPTETPPPATPEAPPGEEPAPPPITVPGIEALPQGVQDTINQAVQVINQTLQNLTEGVLGVVRAVAPVVEVVAPVVEKSAEPIAEVVTVTTGVTSVIAVAPVANSAGNIGNIIAFLRQNLWLLSGIKRRRKPWGTVYDGKTKQPLPFAKVELLNSSYRLLESQITDLNGRYGFLVTPESAEQKTAEIQLQVRKDGYVFPAKDITPPTDTVLYNNVYIGGLAKVDIEALAGFDLPMDNLEPKTPQAAGKKSITKIHNAITNLLNVGFYLGLVTVPLSYVLTPSNLNLAIMAGFLVVNIPRLIGIAQRQFGMAVDSSTDTPMPFSLITLNDKDGKRIGFTVSDERGRYSLLVPEGYYTIVAYTPATIFPTRSFSEQFYAKKGWIKKELKF